MKLVGRRAIVTGASQGFGRAVAAAFLAEGASVMLCARNAQALDSTRQELAISAPPEGRVQAMTADVSRAEDLERLVAATAEAFGGLDILVANAGVYGPKGAIQDVDWDAWSDAITINLLGTVLACRAVLPGFLAQGQGKIILLSGGGATKPLPNLSAYAASKAAVVRFGETLSEEVRDKGIEVNAVAPGALNTRLLEEILQAGPEKVGQPFYDASVRQKEQGGTPLERGADLCVFLASRESDGITGKLLSAVWDPWETLPDRRETLADSDIYTLRRIVPAERGQDWG